MAPLLAVPATLAAAKLLLARLWPSPYSAERTVLALGDSFTTGTNVRMQDTWPTSLEQHLRNERTRPVEVINAGVGGWAPYQYAHYYEHYGRAFAPDVVIVGIAEPGPPKQSSRTRRNLAFLIVVHEGGAALQGIGIDFGTTNSSVALYDGERVRYLRLEAVGDGEVMPTALYLSRDRRATVGRAAIERYTRDNSGRTVRLSAEEVGAITVTVAGTDQTAGLDDGGSITRSFEVHAWTDQDLPGRLFRSVKRWLGSAAVERVRVFDGNYRIVALATPVLAAMCEAIAAAGGGRSAPFVGRPIRYEGRTADANRIAVSRMNEACRHAGLGGARLFPEPIAAAMSYLEGNPLRDGETALAFDFGGGTLDLSVVESRHGQLALRASHGVPIGGDELDRRLYRALVFPELGEGARVHRPVLDEWREEPFPFDRFADRLLNWALAYDLNRPELLELLVQGMREGGEAGRRLERLYSVVKANLSYTVFQAIERAKLALADTERAEIVVEDLDLRVPVSGEDLDRIAAPLLDRAAEALDAVLDAAGVEPGALSVVVRTGGSSRLRAVIRLLEARFPGRVVEHDPFTSIAAGLAMASWRAAS